MFSTPKQTENARKVEKNKSNNQLLRHAMNKPLKTQIHNTLWEGRHDSVEEELREKKCDSKREIATENISSNKEGDFNRERW